MKSSRRVKELLVLSGLYRPLRRLSSLVRSKVVTQARSRMAKLISIAPALLGVCSFGHPVRQNTVIHSTHFDTQAGNVAVAHCMFLARPETRTHGSPGSPLASQPRQNE